MLTSLAATEVRGVIRCPGCDRPLLWLAHPDGGRAYAVPLSEPAAGALVRDLGAVVPSRAATHRLVADVASALGARILRVHVRPDGRGRVRAAIEIAHGGEVVSVPATVRDAVVIAHRLRVPAMVPAALLVAHPHAPVPSCPDEDDGLPPVPEEFVGFLQAVRPEEFRQE